MSPQIKFPVEDVPPIKRGEESMWGKQLDRVRTLRRAAAAASAGVVPATIDDEAHLTVVVYAKPEEGDLDGFVSGICDGLQPYLGDYDRDMNDDDWADLPEAAHPSKGVGISNDKAITTICAERRPPQGSTRYEVSLRW